MYKVILVDDDELVRIGLETLMSFSAKGFRIVDALSSGAQALESIRKHQPDVVITDLYMPEFDGLQLIRQCKKICPDAIIVVLSCHNDIDSIKEALHLGAFDYQLKSSIVDPKNADALLDRIASACELRLSGKTASQGKQAELGRKQTILNFLQDGSNAVTARQALLRRGFDISSDHTFLAGMQLDNYDAISRMVDNEQALLTKIEEYVDEILEMFGSGFCMYVQDGLFMLLLQVNSVTAVISPYSRLVSICERLRVCMKNQFLHTCSVYIDKSTPFDRLPQSYKALMQEIVTTRSMNYDSVIDLVSYSASIYKRETEDEIDLPSHPVENVVRYIEANFAQPLTLDDLAREANFSKYHLCRKFKEITGTGIVDYIQRCRVERAKELLREPDGRYIFNIAQEVGFNDASYFNRIFKKYTGFTPNEFQKLEDCQKSEG